MFWMLVEPKEGKISSFTPPASSFTLPKSIVEKAFSATLFPDSSVLYVFGIYKFSRSNFAKELNCTSWSVLGR